KSDSRRGHDREAPRRRGASRACPTDSTQSDVKLLNFVVLGGRTRSTRRRARWAAIVGRSVGTGTNARTSVTRRRSVVRSLPRRLRFPSRGLAGRLLLGV